MNTTPAARAFIIFVGAIVATGVLVVILLFTTKENTDKSVEQSEENFDSLKGQEAILRIILAVTGCTIEDSVEQCQAKAKAYGAANIIEVDCRVRLAVAGAPAPERGSSCVPPVPTTTTTTTAPPPPPPVEVVPPPPG